MQHDGEQQISAAVLDGRGEHLGCCKGGRFDPSDLMAGFRVRAAQCRVDHGVEGADSDVFEGCDDESAPG